MKPVRFLLAALFLVALGSCAGAPDGATRFGIWASSQEYVASVVSDPSSAESGANDLNAHLAIDGAITGDELIALSSEAWTTALDLGIAEPRIDFIVGNAWGFSLDAAGVHVAAVNALRDVPLFVGGTVDYRPLDNAITATGGVRVKVAGQAALRGAYDLVVSAVTDAGGSVDGEAVSVSTADGTFTILGLGHQQPLAALDLWQAISGRVLITAAAARTSTDTDLLDISVESADDRAVAEVIAADYPDVSLAVIAAG